MDSVKCPYCGGSDWDKFVPPNGDKVFIGTANTKTKSIHADTGFACDLYVCKTCGNVHLKLESQ